MPSKSGLALRTVSTALAGICHWKDRRHIDGLANVLPSNGLHRLCSQPGDAKQGPGGNLHSGLFEKCFTTAARRTDRKPAESIARPDPAGIDLCNQLIARARRQKSHQCGSHDDVLRFVA